MCPLKNGETYWTTLVVPEDQNKPKEGQKYRREECDDALTEGGADVCLEGCDGNIESMIVHVEDYSKKRAEELTLR